MKTSVWSTVADNKYFYISLTVLAVLSIVLLSLPLGHLALNVGEAILIAVILACTVDTYLKLRLAKEVARDVSPYLMAYAIPEPLRNEVAEMCKIELYRTDFDLSFELSDLPEYPSSLCLRTSVNFGVQNLYDHFVSYTHRVWVERSYDAKNGFKQLGHLGARGVFDERRHPADYLESGDGAKEENGGFLWKRAVLIPPKTEPVPAFWSTTYQIVPREHYESFLSTFPIVGLKVRVRHPEWLSVEVKFEHRLGDQAQHWQHDLTSSVWVFEPALLPYSTIGLTWRARETESDKIQIGAAYPRKEVTSPVVAH